LKKLLLEEKSSRKKDLPFENWRKGSFFVDKNKILDLRFTSRQIQ